MYSSNNGLKISIDGGAGTGKSSLSSLLSKEMNLVYISTGLMYRVFTLMAIKMNMLNNYSNLIEYLKKHTIKFDENGDIYFDNIKYSDLELHTKQISNNISNLSSDEQIRNYAKILQQRIVNEHKRIIMEGRDIGTVIMPNADFKFFLTIDPDVAAKRRFKDLSKTDNNITYEDVLYSIKNRNKIDSNRNIAPTKPAKDAILIDTSYETLEGLKTKIKTIIEESYD